MGGVEASGKTVDEAIENALGELGMDRDEVDVQVLSDDEGDARVRVEPIDNDDDDVASDEDADDVDLSNDVDAAGDVGTTGDVDTTGGEDAAPGEGGEQAAVIGPEGDMDEAEFAAQMLDKLLELMSVRADVSIRDAETPGDGLGMANAVLDVEGDDLGILIGRRGETLASLQYLLNLMVAQQLGKQEFFTVDVEGYRRRREDALNSLARRMADQVKRTGRPVTLEPMPPHERRIIHLLLSEHRFVSTESIGEGEGRKVTIHPRRPA